MYSTFYDTRYDICIGEARHRRSVIGCCLVYTLLCIYLFCFVFGIQNFSVPAAGLFSRSRLRGTQGTRLYTTMQVWVPAGLRGACSGSSKSRNLANSHGIAFRPARASQDNGEPVFQLDCSTEQRQNNTRFDLSPFLQRRTLLCVCGHCLCVCVLCEW